MSMSPRQLRSLQRSVFGTRIETPIAGGTMDEGVVHRIDAQGLWFTLEDPNRLFGPAPYVWPGTLPTWSTQAASGHTHVIPTMNQPATGDRVLIVWTRQGLPWAVGWWPA